jgi:TonB family protein
MKLAVAISLVAHGLVIALVKPRLPVTSAIVAMTLVDRAAPPRAQSAPATSRPIAEHARERAPRPHLRRVARALPPPLASLSEPLASLPALSVPDRDTPDDGASDGHEAEATAVVPAAPRPANLSRDPDLEAGSCVRGLSHPSPGKRRGEIVVRLRLALDATGRVTSVDVVEAAGEGFDDIAVRAVRERCRFTAALDDQGRPVPFTIDDFRFRFPPPGIGLFLIQ